MSSDEAAVDQKTQDVREEGSEQAGLQNGDAQEAASAEAAASEEAGSAHTQSEAAASSENSTDQSNSVRPSNYKTRLCLKWQQSGECSFGSRCNFAHGQHEIRNQQQNDAAAAAAAAAAAHGNQAAASNKSSSAAANRKTRLCTRWHQFGNCPYADKCNFAHGVHELRHTAGTSEQNGQVQASVGANKSNYKTRICLNWQNSGQCTYGSRCNFAHGQHELRQHAKDKGATSNGSSFQNMGMPGYGMMPVAQMPFPAMGGDMQFQSPIVPMTAGGNMMMGMAGMSMENFGQPGFVPQIPPMFPTGPLQVPPMMMNMMQRMNSSMAPMGPPGGVLEMQAEATPMVPEPSQ